MTCPAAAGLVRCGVVAGLLLANGCAPLTAREAELAVESAQLAAEAEALALASAELVASASVPEGIDAAASALRATVTEALDCANVALDGATLTIEYGGPSASCTFRGLTYRGRHVVTVAESSAEEVVLAHAWVDLSSEHVAVSGTAIVRWRPGDDDRAVSHALSWTRLPGAATAAGTGEVIEGSLDPLRIEGFALDGDREWTDAHGAWRLRIEGARMRWPDPLPESGHYVIDAPFGKEVTLTFGRASSEVISLVAAHGSRSYHFEVSTEPGGT